MKSPFRSIRQSLFNEGKLLRYLGYAIGEIGLIIIGILFALKINNMNEDRKAQVEFEDCVVQLKEDVRTAIANAERSKSITENFRNRVGYIAEFLQLSDYGPEELDAFDLGINTLPLLNTPQIKVGLIGQLMEGELGIISLDQELARKALELGNHLEGVLDNVQRNSDQMELVAANRLSRYVGFGIDGVLTHPRYNLERLKTDEEFLYLINYVQSLRSRIMGFDDNIAEALESFITVLEEYE